MLSVETINGVSVVVSSLHSVQTSLNASDSVAVAIAIQNRHALMLHGDFPHVHIAARSCIVHRFITFLAIVSHNP